MSSSGGGGGGGGAADKQPSPSLTIDRAAFLLLRVKRVFRKKRQQRKEKSAQAAECLKQQQKDQQKDLQGQNGGGGRSGSNGKPAPLLRSRTLPAIVAPGLSILHAQIYQNTPNVAVVPPYDSGTTGEDGFGGTGADDGGSLLTMGYLQHQHYSKRDSSVSYCGKLLTPRISLADDGIGGERRVSDTGPNYRGPSGGRLSTCSVGGSQPLTRLARLLNQRPSFVQPNSDASPRRLSWERRDASGSGSSLGSTYLPRSSSIDSLADWGCSSARASFSLGWSEQQQLQPPKRSPSPMLGVGGRAERLASIASPAIGRRSKSQRVVLTLFGAIEQGYLDRARAILESTDVDINSVNSDGLTPLDAAVLSNNRPMVKMLLAFGAQEGNQFKTPEALGSHVASLLTEAERRVHDLAGGGLLSPGPSSNSGPSFLEPGSAATATSTGSSQAQRQEIGGSHRGSFSAQHNNLTGCGGGASAAEDKQLAMWERRARALRKMLLGFDQARPPDVPFLVTIDVIGTDSVLARFLESDSPESFFCTKFKIQWSVREDFSIICGERELLDMKQKECRIDGLLQGQKYYFRAASGNLKGYSRFRPTSPAYLTPSSWRDIDGKTARFEGRLEQLDGLLSDLRGSEFSQETPALQRRNHKKKTTIKQLFTATSKFQKNLRRGAFFACLLYHEDKVLVTNEDFLPVIEVDETYPSCVYNDLNWLMKVACTWDDVKSLRQDMEKSNSSSSNHFRIKLLQAATQMQAALCVQDLGQLYYKPIRDIQGTLVFCTVNCVKSPKQVSVLNSRWLPLAKVAKKFITHEDSSVSDILMASIQDQMSYHQLSSVKLSRGLYLGYLKMQSSVDSIQIVVPAKSPNVLPHCKIRDNPHVSSEEWDYLKRMGRQQQPGLEDDEKENISSDEQLHLQQNLGTEQQKLFVDQVAGAARRLFGHMDVSAEDSLSHRLYDAEVIELGSEVSLLVAVPSPESACSVPGTREILLQRPDLLSLPIQVFEMVHLATYHSELIKRYSRLSCVLELDTAQAQHSQREAFSTSELSVAKDRLARLQHLQSRMNSVWKGSRWLVDLVSFARDRGPSSQAQNWGICMRQLLSLERLKGGSSSTLAISICSGSSGNGLKRSLLQIPPRDPKLVKASPGRGSWPGPGVNNGNGSGNPTNLLGQELSKSEQQLPLGSYPRKGSNSSNCSSASEPYKSSKLPSSQPSSTKPLMPLALSSSAPRLPPSKSEDTLARPAVPPSKHQQQRKQHVVSSANTSPLLGPKVMSKSSVASNSESAHSVSSSGDESQPSRQPKLPRPTACVASIAAADRQGGGSGSSTSSGVAASNPVEMPENVVQVYAAYESGMASGTSLKVQLYERTTAREVIRLVVNHLNKTVKLRGLEGPFYAEEELQNFCLVVVIGARERCLRDDFKVLQLQNPWKKGQLCVRQKQEVLAALELSSKHTAYL